MTEINSNNIPKYTHIEKIEAKPVHHQPKEVVEPEEKETPKYVQDTGVLGRSQVKSVKTTDVVDETIALMKSDKDIIIAANDFFEKMYDDFKELGYSDEDSYTNALLAQEEFFGIAQAIKK